MTNSDSITFEVADIAAERVTFVATVAGKALRGCRLFGRHPHLLSSPPAASYGPSSRLQRPGVGQQSIERRGA